MSATRNPTRRLHGLVGAAVVAAFLGTGVYMRLRFADGVEGHDAMRYQYRAGHIYLLLSGLLNLTAAAYLVRSSGWRGRVQLAGSIGFVVVPLVLLVAFFVEPPREQPVRPWTAVSILALFAATMCHLVGRGGRSPAPSPASGPSPPSGTSRRSSDPE